MGHTIKLELPDEVYDGLRRRAEQTGKTLEEFVADWLTVGVQGSGEDALLRLAGVVDSELTDIAERHDYYVGQNWAKAGVRAENPVAGHKSE